MKPGRGPRSLIAFIAITIGVGAGSVGVAPPADAAGFRRDTPYYLSLGDSLAEGLQSIGPRYPGYADQLAKILADRGEPVRLKKLGCGGESTASMVEKSRCRNRAGSQLDAAVAFLDAHRGSIAFITLSIGANDLGIDCQGDLGCATAQIDANLPHILQTLREHAGPGVPIVGTNYYAPDIAWWFDDPAFARSAAAGAVIFNDFLESHYAAASSPVADIEQAFATTDFTTQVLLPGRGTVPLAVYNICTLTWMCAMPPHGPDVHPKTAGYGVMARTLASTLDL